MPQPPHLKLHQRLGGHPNLQKEAFEDNIALFGRWVASISTPKWLQIGAFSTSLSHFDPCRALFLQGL